MISIRASEAMVRDGFVTVPFPATLSAEMLGHIRQYVAHATGLPIGDDAGPDELTRAIMTLSDADFVDRFRKPLRMFPDDIGAGIYEWVESLAPSLGGSRAGINYVSPLECEGNPALKATSFDVFWRCVRPGKPDVGQPHADFQFWELARGTSLDPPSPFDYDERWKIWLPLMGCDSSNSLQVAAGSHAEDVPVETIETPFGQKPSIRQEWRDTNDRRFFCPLPRFENHCVLFHDKLVHRGPANNTSRLRLSGELTILLKT